MRERKIEASSSRKEKGRVFVNLKCIGTAAERGEGREGGEHHGNRKKTLPKRSLEKRKMRRESKGDDVVQSDENEKRDQVAGRPAYMIGGAMSSGPAPKEGDSFQYLNEPLFEKLHRGVGE